MEKRLRELVDRLPTEWLDNYTVVFEAGSVQKHPQARFVNARGECCIVGALAGAASADGLVRSELWWRFLGSELEELSRRFERGLLSSQQVYEEALLALAVRRGVEADTPSRLTPTLAV